MKKKLVKNIVRFVPFVIVWPIIQLLAPVIIKLFISWILQKKKEADERGEPLVIDDMEVLQQLNRYESNLKAVYQR